MAKFNFSKVRARTLNVEEECYRRKASRGKHIVEGLVEKGMGRSEWVEVSAWHIKEDANKEASRLQRKLNKAVVST